MNLGGHRMKFILINSLEVSKECVGQIVFAYLGIQNLYEKECRVRSEPLDLLFQQ